MDEPTAVLQPLCDHGRVATECVTCHINTKVADEKRQKGDAHLLATCRHGRIEGTCGDCLERQAVLDDETSDTYRVALRLSGPAFDIEVAITGLPAISDEVRKGVFLLLDDLCASVDARAPHASQAEERGRGGTSGVVAGAVPPPATEAPT